MICAMDCDGTLIDFDGNPRPEIVDLYHWFEHHGYAMVVWSHAGRKHAADTCAKLGLTPSKILTKNEWGGNRVYPDVAVDDLDLHIAKNMVKV